MFNFVIINSIFNFFISCSMCLDLLNQSTNQSTSGLEKAKLADNPLISLERRQPIQGMELAWWIASTYDQREEKA